MVGEAYPTAFTPVNILSGFKKMGIYPLNPSSVDDRQLAPSSALSTSVRTAEKQPRSEGELQPILFFTRERDAFSKKIRRRLRHSG